MKSGVASDVIKLIDDSNSTLDPKVNQGGRVFNIVSGSISSGKADIKTTVNQPWWCIWIILS